ncbi:MAG TPA: hypothetical protein VNI54_07160 [Thermoanaerobaculia bacterium]|nr:hypothetical protein [Thermoanaerobaculia bacterium]
MTTLLFLATTALGQVPPTYRVLLPVYFEHPAPGAFGSQWKTAYAVNNPTPHQFHVEWCAGSTDPFFGACSRPLLSNAHLAAGETETTLPPFSGDMHVLNGRGGPRLLYILPFSQPPQPVAWPSVLSFALRAFDTSRSATNAGTEVPVVREEQFRKNTTSLLNVPVHPSFRLTFRLYELNLKVAGFTVRVFDQQTNRLVGEKDLVLSWHFAHHWVKMFEPPHVQIGDIRELLPAATALPETLRIEIQPRSEGSEFWAFVSITNNETQHLTLVTPQ